MVKDQYSFPIIVHSDEEDEGFPIRFPDFSRYENHLYLLESSMEAVEQMLGKHLYWMEQIGAEIPTPTSLEDLEVGAKEKATLLDIRMPPIRELENTVF